jgi:hypothetical protein
MPAIVSVEEVKRGRAILNELAEKAGRDPKSIEVLAFGQPGQFRERKEINDLEKAGVDYVTIWLKRTEGDEAIAELEELARRVLS